MREIKFRAWNLDHKFWDDRVFVSGDGGIWDRDIYYDGEVAICMCTGLKDKNGVEIYEGDIVRDAVWVKELFLVVWSGCGFDPFQYDGGGEVEPANCEVISNIYENPELME